MKRIFSLAILTATVLLAQPPGGPGGPRARQSAGGRQAGGPAPIGALREALDLTDSQIQQLRDLRKSQMEALKPTYEQMRTKQQALKQEMDNDNPNPAAVGQLTVELKQLRKSIADGQADRTAKALTILNPEQQDKLKALKDTRGRMPAMRQAMMMGLLAPPEGAGAGMMRMGPGMMQREGRRTPPPQQQQ